MSAVKKTGAKRGRPKKNPPPSSAKLKKKKVVRAEIIGLVFIALSIFTCISFFSSLTGVVGKYIKTFFLGIFGGAAFLVPLMFLYIGLNTGLKAVKGGYGLHNFSAFGIVIITSAFIHIFARDYNITKDIVSLYNQSSETLLTGGAVGGFITCLLIGPFGKLGTIIIYATLLAIFTVVAFGVTLEQLFSPIIRLFRKFEASDEEEEAVDEEEAVREIPQKSTKRNKKFKIDLPIDDEPKKTEPSTVSPEILDKLSLENKTESNIIPSIDIPIITKQEIAQEEHKIEKQIESEEGQKATEYKFPPLTLLSTERKNSRQVSDSTAEVESTAIKIVETLKSFGVSTKIVDISKGPTITRYELQPSAGVKISKITGLADDIALNLAASGVRIEAPIPGKAAVGIEVPNKNVKTVYIRNIIDSEEFKNSKSNLTFALGSDIGGATIVADISKMPHMLIAGATGSGKSVCINTIITSILYKSTPEDVRLILIDPKVVELGVYNGIPHLLIPVVTDPKKASGALSWAVGEMLKRYKLFAEKGVRDINGYNQLAVGDDEIKPLNRIVIIIDELADLMMVSPAEVEDSICRLAQMARAAGMHLVIATQRPSVDVITGTIKANIPSRIAFAVSSAIDSRTILDAGGAEKLIGRGDMLYYPMGAAKPIRVQGCFVSDKEVEAVVKFIKNQGKPDYDEDVMDQIEKEAEAKEKNSKVTDSTDDEDPLLQDAIECVVESGSASTSLLQRRLKLGYARAARIIDEMEQRGIVGPYEGSKPRQVLITKQQLMEMQVRQSD